MTADPVRADPARLVHACRRISVWADAHDASGTRLSFVQAAARLRPRDAALAVEVVRLARELGQHARSESWFRHAIRIARGTDWTSYAWAYVGLGVLYIRTGNRPGAETLLGRALRTARRRRLGPVAGTAHHHLFHLTTEAGRLREGYEHARAALEVGQIAEMQIAPAEVFKAALLCNAAAVVLAHNHPSGDTLASESDVDVTADLELAGAQLGVFVLDPPGDWPAGRVRVAPGAGSHAHPPGRSRARRPRDDAALAGMVRSALVSGTGAGLIDCSERRTGRHSSFSPRR